MAAADPLGVLRKPDPVADPRSAVVDELVRVTVLTDRLLRLEFAADGAFEDRASMSVINRHFPRVDFDTSGSRPGALVVDTGAVRVECTDTGRPFARSTLVARLGTGGRRATTWHYGQRDTANLGGTRRTLDGWRGDRRQKVLGFDATTGDVQMGPWQRQQLDDGLLSRSGWAVVDDSGSPLLDPYLSANRTWPVARAGGRRQDLYLFAYGTDHVSALRDAACLFGPQPLPPRFAFGYWYSRYYAYTDREVEAIATQHDEAGIPLDVVVVDMDWHRPGWTGYSWDRRYFPDPDDTLRHLHEQGVRVALNLHPADGIGRHEDAFAAMCEDLGLDATRTDRIPFDSTDPAFVESYFHRLHHPEEMRGVDVWWMDWQQGKTSDIEGLDPLPWLNALHWDDQKGDDQLAGSKPSRSKTGAVRRGDSRRGGSGRRPLIFSRWGGLGGGRYPMGFSGDTWSVWESLAYQPHFTATAANVLYGYWSHDIGGHYGPATTPELYTRWVQFGVFSPILRTHGTKDPDHERRLWEFADPYRSAMIEAVRRRYELVPYVYGECRRGVETGASLVRPMYHEHPNADDAYLAEGQYQFGRSMVVAPVVAPAGDEVESSVWTWLPRGKWYDTAHGVSLDVRPQTGEWHERGYLLDEIPVFVAAGSVIPGQRGARRLSAMHYEKLVVTAYPGGSGEGDGDGEGAGELYEDDGVSNDYLRGRSVTVPLRQRTADDHRQVRIGPAHGDYRGWERRRTVDVCFVGEPPPRRVRVGERTVSWSPGPAKNRWWYDAGAATVVVRLRGVDLRRRTRVHLDRDPAVAPRDRRLLDGYPGIARRLDGIAWFTGMVSPHYELHPDERLAVDLAQAANRVARAPDTWIAELRRVRRELKRLDTVLAEFQEGWRTALALPFADPREKSVELLTQARMLLAATEAQFG